MPLSNDIKQAALVGLRHRRDELGAQIAGLERELRGNQDGQPALRKKRRLSAAGRRRIAQATRRRWAEYHAQKQAAEVGAPAKKAARRAGSKKTRRTRQAVK
jgi:hypothetical protein